MIDIKEKEKYENALGPGWKIGERLGEGNYGSVYEIERTDLGVTFKSALKIISIPKNDSELREIMVEMDDEDSARIYFESVAKELTSELSVMATLKGHTNIVSYEDHLILKHDDNIGVDILIRMERLTPLLNYIKDHRSDKELVLKLGMDICSALSVCERYNIIHRDIKPANIFVSEAGDFKLGDFGVAKIVERATTSSSVGAGTPDYMAPEVRLCKGKYRSNVDIYSLGIVLYQLSNHMRLPFYPRYPEPVYVKNKEEASVRRLRGDKLPVPDDTEKHLSSVILKACDYNPNNRYISSKDMSEDLRCILENKSPHINDHNYWKMITGIGAATILLTVSIGIIAYQSNKGLSESDNNNSINIIEEHEADEATAENGIQNASDYRWIDSYISYLSDVDDFEYPEGRMIYVNDDQIPEILLEGNGHYLGSIALTVGNDNSVREHRFSSNASERYVPKKNIIYDFNAGGGGAYDDISCIENGEWKTLFFGTYSLDPTSDTEESEFIGSDYYIYENGFYEEGAGKKVSEEEYNNMMNEIFMERGYEEEKANAIEEEKSHPISDLIEELKQMYPDGESVREDNPTEIISEDITVANKDTLEENTSENNASDDDLEKTIIDYEEAYAPVLDEYKRLLEDPSVLTDETKVPSSFRDKVQLYSLGIDDIYYVFLDLDNNSIDEMIILNRSFGDDYVCAVYSLENERIIPIDFSAVRMERDGIYLYNSKIVGINAGGTGYVKKCFCRLDQKTFDWDVVETIVMLCGQDGISKYYKSNAQESREYDPEDTMEIYTEISEEEMNALENRFEEEPDIDRNPLANYGKTY